MPASAHSESPGRELRPREMGPSVEASASCEPLHRLAGHPRDRVEVAIVVEEHRVVHFSDCCDQEIDRARPAVLAPLGEGSLSPRCDALRTLVHWEMPEAEQIVEHPSIIGGAASRDEEFEPNRRTQRERAKQL